MGFKLKHHLIHVLTADNIDWCLRATLPLDSQLAIGGNLSYVSEKLSKNHCNADEVRTFFRNEKTLVKKWIEQFEKLLKLNSSIDDFPIIVCEGEEDRKVLYSLHDGNRRMVL